MKLTKRAVADAPVGFTWDSVLPSFGVRVLARAGVKGRVRIHDLRHTVGSYAHREGASQRDVADLLGHKQMSTAARYIHGPASEKHKNAARATSVMLRMAGEK